MERTGNRMPVAVAVFALITAILAPTSALAQRDAREVLRDHSVTLRAGDLNFSFIYLNKSAPDVASQILTAEEFGRWQKELETLTAGWTLIAVRVTPYRETRFDPTLISFTQRENSHPVGFQDVVDVRGMFNSTVARGDNPFGFLKVSDRIDWRQSVAIGYGNDRTEFTLPLKWRQQYFQFLDGRPPPASR